MYDKYAAHIVPGHSNLKDGVWRWIIRNEQYSLALIFICISRLHSVQFSHSIVSDSL